jgi:hypothetical protein
MATEKDELSDFAFQIPTGFLPVLGILDVVKKKAPFGEHLNPSFCDVASVSKPSVEFSRNSLRVFFLLKFADQL